MEYSRAIGGLCWLADTTRPDIAFATRLLGRFLDTPEERHWLGIQRGVRYLVKMRNLRLKLSGKRSTEELVTAFKGYMDANLARAVV